MTGMREVYDEENPEIVYHAPPGSFRKHETKEVRDMAEGRVNMTPGLFKALVSTRGNRFTFFTLVFFLVLVIVLSLFGGAAHKGSLSGVSFSLSAFSFEDKVYCSVETSSAKKNSVPAVVSFDVACEVIDVDGAVCEKLAETVTVDSSSFKPIHWVFSDYDAKKIRVSVSRDGDSVELDAKVQVK